MTTIRCRFPVLPISPSMGLRGMQAAELTSIEVELTVNRRVPGHESHDEREAMYAALFGTED